MYHGESKIKRLSSECIPNARRRVKTRLLNFENLDEYESSEHDLRRNRNIEVKDTEEASIGVLKIVDGPGRGSSYSINKQRVKIGRGEGQDIYLPFDDTISRDCHAMIAYNSRRDEFVLTDGRKPNPIRLNGLICKRSARIDHGDILQIGITTLLFHRVR